MLEGIQFHTGEWQMVICGAPGLHIMPDWPWHTGGTKPFGRATASITCFSTLFQSTQLSLHALLHTVLKIAVCSRASCTDPGSIAIAVRDCSSRRHERPMFDGHWRLLRSKAPFMHCCWLGQYSGASFHFYNPVSLFHLLVFGRGSASQLSA